MQTKNNLPKPVRVSAQFGGSAITFEAGKRGKLADGYVTVEYVETVVDVAATSATTTKEGQNWLPLSVEYRERAGAVGRIPGGYFRREGRPTEKEILTARMTDRPLRPLLPKGYYYDTQIIATVMSADGQNDPDILCINGASAALMISDIPFAGPIGAARVGRIKGQWVCNPTHAQMADSDLDLVYVGTEKEVLMIEGSALELSDDEFKQALEFAQEQVQVSIKLQKELAAKVGKPKRQLPLYVPKPELLAIATSVAGDKIEAALYQPSKVERSKSVGALREQVKAKVKEQFPETSDFDINSAFGAMEQEVFRSSILKKKKRCDGRGARDVRPISGETGFLPRTHGSSLFCRGETQAVCLTTLAPIDEAQEMDGYTGGDTSKRFILHYNFPPFSVGETGRVGGLNRREIGHGALAERSLLPVVPSVTDFPYAIRIASEITESNGSTSMASVCGGCLALMDAGVKLTAPVAGISVGLVSEYNAQGAMAEYLTITDIIGSEDHYGDMDFKLAGTRKGVTGYQLDLKLPGIPLAILKEAVDQAKTARMEILDAMDQILATPRNELSKYAPRIVTMKIDPEKIGMVIGPGGKMIKSIVAETGAEVNVEDDGTVRIYSHDEAGMARAKEMIEGITAEIEVGKLYHGKIVTIKEFGAFVEVLPGRDGLVHISEWGESRVNRMEDVARMGDMVWVKCIGKEPNGKCKLSRKAALRDRPPGEGETREERPSDDRDEDGGDYRPNRRHARA